MPATPTDFSYDRDIAPATSRFFNRVEANPNLTHAAKMRLQSSTLGGVEAIETQRLKLQAERDEGRARQLKYEGSVMALEEARAARTRAEQSEARRGAVTATAKSILDGDGDAETKRQRLARTALDYADDKDALETFNLAAGALPKESAGSGFTPSQIAGFTERLGDEVSPEDLPKILGNPALLGKELGRIAEKETAAKEAQKLKEDQSDQAKAQKLELAKMPLKFQKGEVPGEESDWLEDSSTAVATKVVEALGTPEERQRFTKLKTAGSDRERAMMVELIQLRHRFDNERPSEAKPRWDIHKSGKSDPAPAQAPASKTGVVGATANALLDAATGQANTSKRLQELRDLSK